MGRHSFIHEEMTRPDKVTVAMFTTMYYFSRDDETRGLLFITPISMIQIHSSV